MSNIQSFFSENGYYLAKGVYDSSQLPGMQDDFDRIVRQLLASKENINARWGSQLTRELEDADSVVYHTHNVQCYSAIWLQALLNPDFLDVAEEILGSDVVLHHTKLFQKPPNQGAAFPIHQDWQYFPTLQEYDDCGHDPSDGSNRSHGMYPCVSRLSSPWPTIRHDG